MSTLNQTKKNIKGLTNNINILKKMINQTKILDL